jgi:competence protein ComEA
MKDFETGKGRHAGPRKVPSGLFVRYRPQIVVCALVVLVLTGGAYYSSRASESAPRVVYSMSLEEAKVEAQTPLLVDLNTADAEELDELPGVGPSTAEAIMEHRRINGSFDTVEELSSFLMCIKLVSAPDTSKPPSQTCTSKRSRR